MPEPDDDFDAFDRLDAEAEDYLSPEEREARRKQFQDVVQKLRQERANALARGEAPAAPTEAEDDELEADWDDEHEGLLDDDDAPTDVDDTDDEDY